MNSALEGAIGIFGCIGGMVAALWIAALIDELVHWKKRHKH